MSDLLHRLSVLGRRDVPTLQALLLAEGLTALPLVWREAPTLFRTQNRFRVGGAIEDPVTGAGAAALGGHLHDPGPLAAPATLLIRQGEATGRPSRRTADSPVARGIVVRGTAVRRRTPATRRRSSV